MNSTQVIVVTISFALVICAGLLAAGEAALSTFSRTRAGDLVAEGRTGATTLARIVADPAAYLNTSLFVRTMCEITSIVLVAMVMFDLITTDWIQVLVTAGIMTVISYIAWGVAPRTLGRRHPDGVALSFAGPVMALTTVLGPFPKLLILIGNALTPGKGFRQGPFSTEAELRELVDMAEASELIASDERRMIHSVFELGDSVVREVMVPRTDMVHIEDHKTLRQVMSLALRSGFSRIPVIGEGIDDVVGVIYLKDLIRRWYDDPDAQTSERAREVMRPAHWCPESKPVDELLHEMQRHRTHLVMVFDEFGGTAGMVTIEDILEEIVGEIRDEFDTGEQAPFVEVEPGLVRVSARFPVDELGDLFDLELDDDDVDSVGGLMAKELNQVPIPGSTVKVAGLELTAERTTGRRNRIATVLVRRITESTDDEAEAGSVRTKESVDG